MNMWSHMVETEILDDNNAATLSGVDVEPEDVISCNSALCSPDCRHLPHLARLTAR
jgi:hypothetical protein